MTRCQIALGGNVGDVRAVFHAALTRLSCPDVEIVATSRCFETPAMGDLAGPAFLNAAATLETTLDANSLLQRLLDIESGLGRVREVHWGPRGIDLDLILYGDQIIETPTLRVPHSACWYRRFVLEPLAEIAPEVVHPETGECLVKLRDRLLDRPFRVAVSDHQAIQCLEREFRKPFPEVSWHPRPDDHAPITLLVGHTESSAAERTVGVSKEPPSLLQAVRAILMAALGEPRPIGDVVP